jgi:gamma-D-glutamyl-L-lysine dipeptidyl-peptidase
MNYAINLLPVIPMRKEPAHRSEMVSQLLFGEYVETRESEKDFIQVKCIYDSYEGWVQANQLTSCNAVQETSTYTKGWIDIVKVNNSMMHVPKCSPVYMNYNQEAIGVVSINYNEQERSFYNSKEMQFDEGSLISVAYDFLDTPYLWGGKSVFGIDCSGFVQQVFKLFGVKLLRDAYLQAGQGTPVDSLELARAGDLGFFHNEAGRVTHVGIILSNQKIIHASGKVRIDVISTEGIINERGIQTHHLRSIRRYF